MINRFFTIIFILISLIIARNVSASLSINEIYPAPATGDYEWVELFNSGSDSADLTQFLLTDLANNKIKINETTLSAQSYFIASCSSILNNGGDTVFLKNIWGEVIDIATYSGTFTSDKSYTKCLDSSWLTTNIITKNFSNETACLSPTPSDSEDEPTNTPIPTSIPTSIPVTSSPTATPVSYDNIFLSEVYPYPNTDENEWVEIYNGNDFLVELKNWYIDDIENGGSSLKSINLIIEAKNYGVFDLTSSMFNNTGDSVRLLDSNKSLKDSFEYTDCEKGKSWARSNFDSDEFCQQEPTKNTANSSCINTSLTSTPTQNTTNYPQPTTNYQQQTTNHQSLATNNKPLTTNRQSPIASPQVLGEKTNIIIPKNNQKSLTKTLSFIAFSNSLLTIISILLKIKIHEAIKLFS